MNDRKHCVKRVVFELTVEAEVQAQRLHDELGHLHRTRVVPLLEQCLAGLAEDDELIRIDTLELDLGNIRADVFEDGLVGELADRLSPALRQGAAEARSRAASSQESVRMSRLEMFVTYARTGCLPWWADASAPDLLDGAIDLLVDKSPGSLRRILPKLAADRRALQRIVRSLDTGRLAHLAAIQSGLDHAAIARSMRQLIAVIETDSVLSRAFPGSGAGNREARAVRHGAWEAALTAVVQKDARTDVPGFWRMVLNQVAVRSRIDYRTLLTRLNGAAGRRDARRLAEDLQGIVRSLIGQLPSARPGGRAAAANRRHQADPGPDRVPGNGGNRIVHGWPEVLRLLGKSAKTLEDGDRDRLREILAGLLDAGVPPPAHPDAFVPAIERALHGDLDSRTRELLRKTLRDARRKRSDSPAERDGSEHDFADPDGAYVDNCGLVILWPFLERYFGQLGLLKDKQFKGASDAGRAVGLLQHIATGDPHGPEYRLPLNKVLCGTDPADVCAFGDVLTDAEAEESDRLLEAAIGHAPILRNMSVDGFRGSFLLRSGVLGVRDDTWILRVERQSFDVVLDRFPWSFNWIKLPWMPAALSVEW